MCARWGRPAGITATAHKLARIIFHMVTTGRAYNESIFAAEEQRQRKPLESSLRRKAAKLGYQLIPLPQTAQAPLQAASKLFIRSKRPVIRSAA